MNELCCEGILTLYLDPLLFQCRRSLLLELRIGNRMFDNMHGTAWKSPFGSFNCYWWPEPGVMAHSQRWLRAQNDQTERLYAQISGEVGRSYPTIETSRLALGLFVGMSVWSSCPNQPNFFDN